MIFRPPVARKIVRGEKTEHRRAVARGESKCPYDVGKSYVVQYMRASDGTRATAGRVLVTSIDQGRLGDMQVLDARREGFRTTDEFLDDWRSTGGRHDPSLRVWIIRFEHDTREVVRLMHRQSEKGYTTLRHEAMSDEPEAVDEVTLEQFVKDNTKRFEPVRAEQQAERRRHLHALAEPIREEVRALATRKGKDMTKKLWRLEKVIEEIDRDLAA